MSKFLSPNFKKKTKETLSKVEVFRRVLPDEELKKVALKFQEFENNPENEKKLFVYDNKTFMIIETPAEAIVKQDENGDNYYANGPQTNDNKWFWWTGCKFKLGGIMISGNVDVINEISTFGISAFVSSSYSKQFSPMGIKKYYTSLEELCKEHTLNIGEIKEGEHYSISNTITIYQIIESW